MSMQTFNDKLNAQWAQKKFLCVGLDTDFEKIPESLRRLGILEAIVKFNKAIVDATRDIAGSYKPNSAFYEAHGDTGFQALRQTIQYVRETAPETPVILDAKRGDIGNTNEGYIRSAFEHLRADAITVQPYQGKEALQPFLDRKDKGIIVLAKTSNPGAGEFQDLLVDGEKLYRRVARNVAETWNENGNCGLVVGATYPEELKEIRALAPELPFLIPGIGAQGGDISLAVKNAKDARGAGFIIAASRSILYASPNDDFADAARGSAQVLHSAIRKALLD